MRNKKTKSKLQQENLSLIIAKNNNFDKILRSIRLIFFNKNLKFLRDAEKLTTPKKINTKNIIIPKESNIG